MGVSTESVFRCCSTTGPIIGVRPEALTAARKEPLCAVCVRLGPTDCTRRVGPNAAQRERGERGRVGQWDEGGGVGATARCSIVTLLSVTLFTMEKAVIQVSSGTR